MPRKEATSARKRKADAMPEDDDINPEDFFGASPAAKPKAKPRAKAKAKAEPVSMDIDTAQTPVVGFAASELPNVAPKHFWSAPKHSAKSGSIDLPSGDPECLGGLKFVITGEFVGLSREDMTDLIKSFGGSVTSAVSGKTSYLVVGEDPGSSKIKKAKTLGTRCLREDDLLNLIRSSKKDEPEPAAEPAPEAAPAPVAEIKPVIDVDDDDDVEMKEVPAAKETPKTKEKAAAASDKGKASATQPIQTAAAADTQAQPVAELWTEKYKPTKLRDLCGHKEPAKRILQWLSWWAAGDIPEKRAVLISGPPGIGKTTTAHLVAKLAGFDAMELNASETRNKGMLQSILGSAVGNRSVLEFDRAKVKCVEDAFENEQDKDVLQSVTKSGGKRLLVIMDEVDGMSGGDRGGSTELIQLIKRSKVPIICICNDRQSTKVRSLANHCEDMRFRRPSEAQMRARLNTIAFRENLKIDQNAIGQMVQSTHNDIRQIINLMSSYALSKPSMSYMEAKAFTKANKKEVAINPFDAIHKYMSCSENMAMSFYDKLDLYYTDFSIMPLFVQENYIDMMPNGAADTAQTLEKLSAAADMIADADVVETRLRGSQQWSLMPLHAALSCVGPSFHARGRRNLMLRFPGWLGQNSKGMRLARQLREVQSHMRLRVAADKNEIRQSYIPAMVPELTRPLISQGTSGIADVVSTMDHYYLTKEHWDAMLELHLEGEATLKQIPTAVKSAFTREYNKGSHPVAFQEHGKLSAVKATAAASLRPDLEEAVEDDLGESQETSDEADDDTDALVKPVKAAKRAAGKAKAAKAGGAAQRKKRKV
ncbi:DNA replication factor C complex subunit Rfc1 [Coemansia erecta]|nr:DNA replication factor C complex subunit Rfc1 [Coemansia sp. RSA 2618]KAJ2825729.1 DNA replication factor C complex subunit Rfc1 [Coemansia erecta]